MEGENSSSLILASSSTVPQSPCLFCSAPVTLGTMEVEKTTAMIMVLCRYTNFDEALLPKELSDRKFPICGSCEKPIMRLVIGDNLIEGEVKKVGDDVALIAANKNAIAQAKRENKAAQRRIGEAKRIAGEAMEKIKGGVMDFQRSVFHDECVEQRVREDKRERGEEVDVEDDGRFVKLREFMYLAGERRAKEEKEAVKRGGNFEQTKSLLETLEVNTPPTPSIIPVSGGDLTTISTPIAGCSTSAGQVMSSHSVVDIPGEVNGLTPQNPAASDEDPSTSTRVHFENPTPTAGSSQIMATRTRRRSALRISHCTACSSMTCNVRLGGVKKKAVVRNKTVCSTCKKKVLVPKSTNVSHLKLIQKSNAGANGREIAEKKKVPVPQACVITPFWSSD